MNVVSGFAMKNGPQDTLFGLIGETKGHSQVRALGGLVDGGKPNAKVPSGLVKKSMADKTERHICGKNATSIPGKHMGQVPYPGRFMKKVGPKL